jgi:hypothetical protein
MGEWSGREEVARLFDGLMGRGAYYAYERQFWHALWRVPPIDAVEEHGIEARHYGPVRAFAYRHEPLLSMFNVVLGADLPGAISEGHLGDALSWTESMGLDVRIPLRGSSEKVGEAAEAADYLRTHGYRRTGLSATFAREAGPPGFEPPPGIEVEEATVESETFSGVLTAPYDLEWTGSGFFDGLPAERDWRTYLAVDESGPIAAAATMMHYDMPQMAFAGTLEQCRGRGAHLALLHRRVEDAAKAGARKVFAITEETFECPAELSPGGRNLMRAGFRLVDTRAVWQPPEGLLHPSTGRLPDI